MFHFSKKNLQETFNYVWSGYKNKLAVYKNKLASVCQSRWGWLMASDCIFSVAPLITEMSQDFEG